VIAMTPVKSEWKDLNIMCLIPVKLGMLSCGHLIGSDLTLIPLHPTSRHILGINGVLMVGGNPTGCVVPHFKVQH
jgi:hypothetical protein